MPPNKFEAYGEEEIKAVEAMFKRWLVSRIWS